MSVARMRGHFAQLVVAGALDDSAARDVMRDFWLVMSDEPRKVELDLRGVTAFTDFGALAISSCLNAGRRLEQGVGIRVASEVSRRLLLESSSQM